jgi:hypothetical protein
MSTVTAAHTNAIQANNPLFIATETDGKGLDAVEGMEWVKIPEKKVDGGRGKGKTVAAVSVPALQFDAGNLSGILNEAVNTLRRELIVNLYRAGQKEFTGEDISEDAVASYWTSKNWSAEGIASWFDMEMEPVLVIAISAAKGWNDESLSGEQQQYVASKCAAYKASYVACADKFPKLNAAQSGELLRVLNLAELSGPIADRIREKITPKIAEESLGF